MTKIIILSITSFETYRIIDKKKEQHGTQTTSKSKNYTNYGCYCVYFIVGVIGVEPIGLQ